MLTGCLPRLEDSPENPTEAENPLTITPHPIAPPTGALTAGQDQPRLRRLAAEMETVFLSEMLGYAGLGAQGDTFGGGVGEEQFSSFLRQEQAGAMVRAGGIGLAESLFRAMGGKAGGSE